MPKPRAERHSDAANDQADSEHWPLASEATLAS